MSADMWSQGTISLGQQLAWVNDTLFYAAILSVWEMALSKMHSAQMGLEPLECGPRRLLYSSFCTQIACIC